MVAIAAFALASCGSGSEAPTPTASPTITTPSPTAATSATPPPAATAAPSATAAPPPDTAVPPPTAAGAATVIRQGDASQRRVVLTFDAGSDVGYTSQILDTLRANSITAAFGMTGRWAEENPSLLRRIVNEGHELINHSYDHASFTGLSSGAEPLSREERWSQLDRTESAVARIGGASTLPYFRPPFGDYDDSVASDAGARGYRYLVMWTVDSGGWRGWTVQQIVDTCLAAAEPGAIYILHVGSASQDGPALQRVIDGLRARGYALVPLSTFAP